ncbi:MAG: iron-containing alcohol dehydrogenase [Prevotella sp.]|jgi:alcohol dehydrogenase class IV|nr:iron-containing alcohol dehydrogenase [Prevotella sp.]
MEKIKQEAIQLLIGFKGDKYIFGTGVFSRLGTEVAKLGKKVSVIIDGLGYEWASSIIRGVEQSVSSAGLTITGDYIHGARPNAPREDVFAIAEKIKEQKPDAVLSFGGGSTTDAVKAAIAFHCLGDKYPDIDDYFGTGEVSKMLAETKRNMLPHFAVMTVAGSAAHLTKYSNITDIHTGQKLLMVDEALVPAMAMFDYSFSATQPPSLTIDGALDGISHGLEALMGIPEALYAKAEPVCLTCIELIVNNIKKVVSAPNNITAREAVGLGTDLGGYAIMIGGTNGAHLNSFSMTDILSHGRACALLNPYYVVFFSTSISERLKKVAQIYKRAGYISEDIETLNGRELGLTVAGGMIKLSEDICFPTTLKEVPGYREAHKIKCLKAAKDPKLESKLKNMPVPMQSTDVDKYMAPILEAAESGNMSLIKNIQ